MSFRELRNFTELMRALGYPRLISVENFRTPNFELVADVLYWMVKRYDPEMVHNITDNIESEDDRVEFLTSISQALLTRAKIKLNAKRLYAADGYAVKELLKVATTLYSASRVNVNGSGSAASEDESELAPLATRLKDIKGARTLASEITDRGARLYDLLGKEKDVKADRTRALKFLDAISSNLESTAEHTHIESSIKVLISAVSENISSMSKHCEELEQDEKNLKNKISKKQADLERHEKRLKSLQTVRPAFMDEYEKLEMDLQRQYDIYLERFRNLDYLENELDLYNKSEKEKLEENDRTLKRMQKRLREEELRLLRGEQAGDGTGADDAGAGGRAGGGGGKARRAGDDGGDGAASGNMGGDDEESESEDISDDEISHDSDSDDSDAVSLAASSMSDNDDEIEDDEDDSEMSEDDYEGGGDYGDNSEGSEDNF